MRISKKITALFIAVMMVVSAIPFTASAASDPYLTFTGTDSFSIQTGNSAKNWDETLQYSTDANTWTTWDGTSQISSDNNVLYLRGTGNTQITGDSSSNNWVITTQGTVACSGDIRTLLDYDDPEYSDMDTYCFAYLFNNCTSLTAAPELPATSLESNCYNNMFYGCTSLTMAPELPATSLANGCYRSMFQGCTSLTTPSELPATDLSTSCYRSMFQGCTGIKLSTTQTAEYSVPYSIPKEETGSMGSNALSDMFTGTGGTFTGTPTINTTYYLAAPAPVYTDGFMIGDNHYDTLAEAITAAQSGDTITFLEDVTGNFTIPAGKNITLDLNSHTMTASSTGTPVITNRGTLNVYGGTIVNNGLYFPGFLGEGGVAVMNYGVATVNVTTNMGAIVNRSTSSTTPNLIVEGGTYVGNPLALSSENNSYTVINGGNFTGGTSFVRANSGATTEVNDGNFACLGTENESNWIVNGGEINSITVDPGSEDISITINDGNISSLPSTSTVNNSTNVSVEVYGGTFDEDIDVTDYMPADASTIDNGDGTYTVVTTSTPEGANLTLEHSIKINVYANVDDYLPENFEEGLVLVEFTTPVASSQTAAPTTTDYDYDELQKADSSAGDFAGDYIFSYEAAPAQIAEEVTVTVKYDNEVVHTYSTSIMKYCETAIANSSDDNLVALAKAIYDYGKAANGVFSYTSASKFNLNENNYFNTTNVYDAVYDAASYYCDDDYDIEGYTYIATAVPTLRIYVNAQKAYAGYKAVIDDNVVSPKIELGLDGNPTGRICVDITGVLAEDMDYVHTVTFGSAYLTINMLNYVSEIYTGTTEDYARSIYNYHVAAEAYFGEGLE